MRDRRFLSLFLILFTLFSCNRAVKKKPIVVILGVDGADWQLIDPLIQKGRLPLFQKLKEQCAWGPLRTITPAISPTIWTSIATGKTPAKHNIVDFRAKRVNRRGKHPLASSLDIREPLLWEMLGERGRRSVLVNWYLSFPPQPLTGVNVSDFFPVSALSASSSLDEPVRQSVYPPERAAGLMAGIETDYPRVLARMGLPDFPDLYDQRGMGKRHTDFPIFDKLPDLVLQEGVVAKTAASLFHSEKFDLFAAYYKLTDVVQHIAYLCFVDEAFKRRMDEAAKGGAIPEDLANEAYARIAELLCPVYQNVERILQDYFDQLGEREAYFIILSDHGFSLFVRDGTVRYNHIGPEKAPDGIFIVRGPGVKPGRIGTARIFDIAPTVLYVLGLPLDRNMDGEPLRRLFSFKRGSAYAVYRKQGARPGARNQEATEKKLEELKALGYIN